MSLVGKRGRERETGVKRKVKQWKVRGDNKSLMKMCWNWWRKKDEYKERD